MKGVKEKLEMIYKGCKLLKIECLKKELEEYLKDCEVKSIERQNGEWIIRFIGADKEYISLSISLDEIGIIKIANNKTDTITIDKNLILSERTIEKRQNGIVYSTIQKIFDSSNRFNQIVLADLTEQRYIFTKDRINSLIENIDFDNAKPSVLLVKFRHLELKGDLKSQSNFYSEFSTHMNYYFDLDGSRSTKDNIYPTRTYLNGEEISSMYDVDGPNKIYRIYDLYNGIINPRNEFDINSINLGFLEPDTFNLKELKGINKQEDDLIGPSLANVSDTYINYLKRLFKEKFGYRGNIGLDRDTMLLGITYQMTGHNLAKKKNENLNTKKANGDFKFDIRPRIDGIPIDEEHIVTMEQIDKRIDNLTPNEPKRILNRFFKPFSKKNH